MALAAQTSLTAAYNNAAGQGPSTIIASELGGQTLFPGIYSSSSGTFQITGTLILDSGGDPNAVWIFQTASTLMTASGSHVTFAPSGGCPGRVYWQVGSSATLGTATSFIGNILALTSITLVTGATINGRALARNGSVTLDSNLISNAAALACTGGDPHIVCLDGSRLDVYEIGFYRVFDNGNLKDRIIINADVQRNQDNNFDYYSQIWIKITEKCEYLLTFTTDGILVNEDTVAIPIWKQHYTSSDQIHYVFTCESKYNTVCLSTSETDYDLLCSGLMAGQILPLKDLTDELTGTYRYIKPNEYRHNALLAGSAGPQIITSQKNSLHVNDNCYRLLQWQNQHSSGIINAFLDKAGQIREMIICSEKNGKSSLQSWQWIGENHWDLLPLKNGVAVDQQSIHESHFLIDQHSEILLRTQGNGSVSVSFKGKTSNIRGLFFGDLLTLQSLYDLKIYDILDDVKQDLILSNGLSFYQKLIDPMA